MFLGYNITNALKEVLGVNFGEIIKRKRTLKGYTLADVENLTGKKIANISDLETRRGINPNLETMQVFADALDLTFLITKNEPLKAWDCYQEIDLLGHEIEPELEEWIKTPANEIYLRFAKLVEEFGINSNAVKEFSKFLPKK
jgi:transcriptional regulator with XRE-family HTH domain